MLTLVQFVAALLASYAGLYAGVFLGTNSPEELKPGKRYIETSKNVLFGIFVLTVIYLLRVQWPSLLLLLATYAFFRVVHKRWVFTLTEFYIVVAVLTLIVSKNVSDVFLLASIVFLYGLPAGSLIVEPYSKHKTLIVKRRQLFAKAFNLTADFISVVALITLIFFFGTFV